MKIRSWSTRLGIMLVPSTFTGCYTNRITIIARITLSVRSRSHEIAIRAADGSAGPRAGTPAGGVVAVLSSIANHYYYIHARPRPSGPLRMQGRGRGNLLRQPSGVFVKSAV